MWNVYLIVFGVIGDYKVLMIYPNHFECYLIGILMHGEVLLKIVGRTSKLYVESFKLVQQIWRKVML